MDRCGWKDKICCVMSTSQRVILPRIGTTMQVNVEACPYLHYQIRRSKSTRSNTVWPSGGSAQWQIFIGGANRRSIHGWKAAWAGNSIAKEGPFNSAELRSRKGIPLKRQYLYIIIDNRGSLVISIGHIIRNQGAAVGQKKGSLMTSQRHFWQSVAAKMSLMQVCI